MPDRQDPNFLILYVASPTASAAFYADLLGKPPVEASPGFALFALSSGVMLGLWAAHAVEPAATPAGGASWPSRSRTRTRSMRTMPPGPPRD